MIQLLIIVMLFLGACGSRSAEDDVVNDSGGAAQTSDTTWMELSADFADNALDPAMQLVVGTFMLEDLDLVVDVDLAATLVPYWKLFKTLLESDTTAQEEVDGLILEIQEVMTPDQVNYIVGLELTQEDLKTLIPSQATEKWVFCARRPRVLIFSEKW